MFVSGDVLEHSSRGYAAPHARGATAASGIPAHGRTFRPVRFRYALCHAKFKLPNPVMGGAAPLPARDFVWTQARPPYPVIAPVIPINRRLAFARA